MDAPTTTLRPTVRTAAIRAKCAAASPRIRYSEIAAETGYSTGYVKSLLSDGAKTIDVTDALDKIEPVVAALYAERSPSPSNS